MTERLYGGKLADERRAQRRAQLVAAGFELLGNTGSSTTVRAVCAEAGLTSRYFYESFANLDELLVAVFDEVMARTIERATAAIGATDGSLEDTVAALAAAFVAITLDDPKAMRIGFVEAWGSETLMRRRVQTLHSCARLVASLVAAQLQLPDARRAGLDVTAFVIMGGLLESVLGWLDGSLAVDRDTLIREYTAAAVAALRQATTGP